MANESLYKVGLSTVGGLIIGFFTLLGAGAWQKALGKKQSSFAWKAAGLGALWGMTCVQLTPTGGVIMENKTTVNYSVIALHGWVAFLASTLAFFAWIIRSIFGGGKKKA